MERRFQCRGCPGRTVNVGMCPHGEIVCSTVLSNTGEAVEEDIDAIGIHADGEVIVLFDTDEDDNVKETLVQKRAGRMVLIVHEEQNYRLLD